MLFLHGVGGGAWSWRAQRSALAGSLRMYVWEARGHGEAATVRDAGLSDYFQDAREALAAVTQDGATVFVAGHSMGGLLAMALAAEAADSIRGYILIDPVYATGDDAYGHFSPTLGPAVRFLCAPLLRSFEHNGSMSRAIGRWVFERAFTDQTRMEAAWLDQRGQVPFEYPRMLRESFGRPTNFPLRDFAHDIMAPVMLLEGSAAQGGPRFPKLVTTLGDRLGTDFHYEAIVPGGHYLQLDRPAVVNERIAGFVAAHA